MNSQLWRLAFHYENQLQMERQKGVDAVQEQQTIKEKCERLEIQVALLKEEKLSLDKEKMQLKIKVAAHASTRSILTQQLKEKDDELLMWKRKEKLQCDQKTQEVVKENSASFRLTNEGKEKELSDEHQRQGLKVQQEKERLKLELHRETKHEVQDEDDRRERHVRTLRELEQYCIELERNCIELKAQRTVCDDDEHRGSKVGGSAKSICSIGGKPVPQNYTSTRKNLAEVLRKATGISKKVAMNICISLQCDLEAAQTQLGCLKLNWIKKRHDNERYAMALCDLESKLSTTQKELGDSEINYLAQLKEYEEKLVKTLQMVSQHENAYRILALEKEARQQEACEARHSLKFRTEELLTCRSMLEERTQEHVRCMRQAQVQCESLETQLLLAEDRREPLGASKSAADSSTLKIFHGRTDDEIIAMSPWNSWSLLGSGIKEMADFVPQLQTVLGAMNDVLQLCQTHANALPVLSEQLQRNVASEKEQRPILSTALRLLRFAEMLKTRTTHNEFTVTVNIVQSFRKRVLDALALWYECDADNNDHREIRPVPTPKFTTTSRETALILQNWTNDRTKQLGVRRWLAQMEAYPGVPPLRGTSFNRILELPPGGCTLELDDMTVEVKDAFLLLVIPILKQNRALHVSVFTRYAGIYEATTKQSLGNEEVGIEKVWSMRIHVQSTVAQARSSPFTLSPSSRDSPSPLAPTSPTSSVTSSTSSTASSRLQIIQERLQYLHHNF
ncbi:unnamed protein product [Peronospora belbahrii]|uniref:Uncharacterized protein n=1 Tax=Peronospora belbahrii TaxID=622444 RepID=A0ABN8CRG2_9STRA|nr:unnamed protein product [Peronospora belbahrii]